MHIVYRKHAFRHRLTPQSWCTQISSIYLRAIMGIKSLITATWYSVYKIQSFVAQANSEPTGNLHNITASTQTTAMACCALKLTLPSLYCRSPRLQPFRPEGVGAWIKRTEKELVLSLKKPRRGPFETLIWEVGGTAVIIGCASPPRCMYTRDHTTSAKDCKDVTPLWCR